MVRLGVLVFLILLAMETNAMAQPVLNEEGMAMTKKFEGGFKPNMYQIKMNDGTTDVPTIGYGFNMAANGLTNPVMTQQEADALFPTIYQKAVDTAAQFVGSKWATLNPIQQNILADMAYNLGAGGLAKFVDMQAALQGGNLAGVPAEMINSKWYGQVGNRSKGLVDMWNQTLAPTPALAPALAVPPAPTKVKTGRVTPMLSPFEQAFADAGKLGQKKFMFEGKSFTTERK